MRPVVFLAAIALLALNVNSLTCPRTQFVGNYLNYLQLFFQNDDTILSFANTNTQIIKVWERIGKFTPGAAPLIDRMNAFLIKDTTLSQTRAYLYMVWVLMNPDDTLNRIVSFGKFEIDNQGTDPDSITPPNAMISSLFELFFNEDLSSVTFPASRFNNVEQLCANQRVNTLAPPTTVSSDLCTSTPFYGFVTGTCTAPLKTLGSCQCVEGTVAVPAKCTSFTLASRATTAGTRTSSNSLNTALTFTTLGPEVYTLPVTPMGDSLSLVVDTTQNPDPQSTPKCNPTMMKLEYDNYYYLFANYYKNGVGEIVPVVPQ